MCRLAEYRVRVSVVHDLSCRFYSPSTSDIDVEPKYETTLRDAYTEIVVHLILYLNVSRASHHAQLE